MTETFTLAHLSDPHLPPLPAARLRDLAGKRALGYLNWTRNRHKYHRREVLDALVADMQAQRPDHIAVTGDLVNLALEAEFTPAQAWLESVGTPQRVTVVPGNHDAYVRATRHHFADTFEKYLSCDVAGPMARFRSCPAWTPALIGRPLGRCRHCQLPPARWRELMRTAIWRRCPPMRPSGCCWFIIPCTRVRG
jgi:hypothetical protein